MVGVSQRAVKNRASHPWSRRPVPRRRALSPAAWLIQIAVLDVAVVDELPLVAACSGRSPARGAPRAVTSPSAAHPCAVDPPIRRVSAVRVGGGSYWHHSRGGSCRPSTGCARAAASIAPVDWAEPGSAGLARLGHRAGVSCELKSSDLIGRVRSLWPLFLPLASVVATARLDAGDGNALATVVLVVVAVMIPVCTVLANRLDPRQINLVLYGSGLALILLTSMRSSYLFGSDITAEYFDFHQTVVSGVWHTGHLNPYESMLSLTVLPASLHALIGGQDVWIFKLGYPALFAFFPVAVFSLGARFFFSPCGVRRCCDRHRAVVLLQPAAADRQAGARALDLRWHHRRAARHLAWAKATAGTGIGPRGDARRMPLLDGIHHDPAVSFGRTPGGHSCRGAGELHFPSYPGSLPRRLCR